MSELINGITKEALGKPKHKPLSRAHAYAEKVGGDPNNIVVDMSGMAIDLIALLKMQNCTKDEFFMLMHELWEKTNVKKKGPSGLIIPGE